MATGIEQLVKLLQNNPDIAKMLTSSVDIDSIFNLIKSKGVDIAKNELQEYIAKNINLGDVANTVLKSGTAGDIADTVLKSGAAGSILKGILGGKWFQFESTILSVPIVHYLWKHSYACGSALIFSNFIMKNIETSEKLENFPVNIHIFIIKILQKLIYYIEFIYLSIHSVLYPYIHQFIFYLEVFQHKLMISKFYP